jgi:CheY-like chemotaxis protein
MDFLDWIVLLSALGRKSAKRPWVTIAQDVGLVEETLARSARRLIGLTLSELARRGQSAVITKFRVVFEHLFGQWPQEISWDIPIQRASHRVFVVDDHAAILQFLHHSLRRAGFEVTTAASGAEALARIDQQELLPTLVLTDIKMAGMDGIELAKRISRRWPSVRVILMSAFVSPDVVQDAWRHGRNVQFLSKPFTAGRIMALVREACEDLV